MNINIHIIVILVTYIIVILYLLQNAHIYNVLT